MFWYDQWLKTGDSTWLEYIVIYNEDDCQGTYELKNGWKNIIILKKKNYSKILITVKFYQILIQSILFNYHRHAKMLSYSHSRK